MSVVSGYFADDALAAMPHRYHGGKRQTIADGIHEGADYAQPNRELAGSMWNKFDLNGGGRSSNFGGSNGKQKWSIIVHQGMNHSIKDLWSSQSQQVDSFPYHLATGRKYRIFGFLRRNYCTNQNLCSAKQALL
jgi:hypothetical protein